MELEDGSLLDCALHRLNLWCRCSRKTKPGMPGEQPARPPNQIILAAPGRQTIGRRLGPLTKGMVNR